MFYLQIEIHRIDDFSFDLSLLIPVVPYEKKNHSHFIANAFDVIMKSLEITYVLSIVREYYLVRLRSTYKCF